MRAIAAVLVFTSACATTSAEDAAAVANMAVGVADCASNWDDCKAPLLGAGVAAATATVVGVLAYRAQKRHADLKVHIEAPPRAGDIAFVFVPSANVMERHVGDKGWQAGYILIDPATHDAYIFAPRRGRVCVAYAPTIEAAIDELHCEPVRPHVVFAASP